MFFYSDLVILANWNNPYVLAIWYVVWYTFTFVYNIHHFSMGSNYGCVYDQSPAQKIHGISVEVAGLCVHLAQLGMHDQRHI
jgi:hypothetical protein